MPRLLVMSERTIAELERATYLQTLAVRRERAAAASANFWVFEQKDRHGLFLEFVESGSAQSLEAGIRAISEGRDTAPELSPVWREVTGLD